MVAPVGRQPATLSEALGAEIRAERNAKRLTQAVVFDAAGISKRAYINYESGAMPINVDQLHAIAMFLHIPVATLLMRAEARLAQASSGPGPRPNA